MARDNTYYLDEALYISAQAPTGIELSFIGGGGPGSGGWGLSDGYPRGTSPTKNDIARVISTRRVLTEEFQIIEKDYSDKYAHETNQLPETINALKAQIKAEASSTNGAASPFVTEQQILSSRISQIRDGYLQILPDANNYFGVPAFYKRGDSMMSRFLDPGFFAATTGQELGVEWATRLQKSWEGTYRLHLEAQKHQALADELRALASQVDQEELSQQPLDLLQVIARRTAQIHTERQIHFDCLPNVLQHELGQTVIDDTLTLVQTFSTYLATAAALVQAKQSQIPPYQDQNPRINSPLSKPQLEGLLHLVDEQRLRRAGPRWQEYHLALALTESIRFLGVYAGATQNLMQRAAEVENLQAQLAAQEEAARQQAEAERLAAEAERQRQEALRRSVSYINEARLAVSTPAVIPIGATTFAVAEAAYSALAESIAAALTRLVATTVPSLAVGTLAMAWPSTLGNSERQYLISTPLDSLSPAGGPDLAALAASSTSIDLPYLLAGVENENELDLYVVPSGKPVAVRAATFDSERQVYSLALDNPQRILTWTPASAPGGDEGNSTSLPLVPPGTVVYTGSSLNPVVTEQEGYPALDLLDQERLIITFPMDSGLPPILVVFKSPRYEAGTSTGHGAQVSDTWRKEAASLEGAPIPAQIAELLKSREFRNFDAFRRQFWKAVANDPELSKQFDEMSLSRMRKNGYSPIVDFPDSHLSQKTFILHHVTPISEGGGVYDMDNIRIVTPLSHNSIHYGTKP
ncbi:pyocin [Pseudomonas putida SJTE-1]|uniref:S-type pyocin domain-containing protein n=2 Tax=Pseudomonas TaxID=286 RepID=A0A7L9GLR1_9PSED|nr:MULTISPECIES: S-type pyocin domain-containing protein [Pseudomonas]AFK68422.1 pyocin S-type Killer domain-containing protein [Pseudomonas putida ND6]ANI05281.1 pyocin [Pseudomonas putida SJTE-1]MEB3436704.1 S-type pyocin domain-containing protein [Pseudomonas sp. A2]POA81289.1 pyocin [Pseudomonas sp. FW305-E2]QOJ93376.1 S-type pyocin domain-containing protein [Pseudomonas taiwanensis]